MKHTFKGGITATSNDAAGDAFLDGMMRESEIDQAPMRRIEQALATAEAVRRDRDAGLSIIISLVKHQGGEAFLPDSDLVMTHLCKEELISYRDEVRQGVVLKTRKP